MVDQWSFRIFATVCLFLLAILCLVPTGTVLVHAVYDQGRFSPVVLEKLLTEGRQWNLLLNSALLALGTALGATLLGSIAGLAIGYLRIAGYKTLLWLLVVPFLVPSYLLATVWMEILNLWSMAMPYPDGRLTTNPIPLFPSGALGCCLVGSLSLFPVVMVASVYTLHRMDRRLEEAAQVSGAKGVFGAITLPLILPGILTGSMMVLIITLTGFTLPMLFQVPVYPVEIYTSFSAFHDYHSASAQAIPLLVCGLVILACWTKWVKPRCAWLTGSQRTSTLPRGSSGLRLLVSVFCWCLVGVAVLLPLSRLLIKSFPIESFYNAARTAGEELFNSLIIAGSSATLISFRLPFTSNATSTGTTTLFGYFCISSLIPGINPVNSFFAKKSMFFLPKSTPFAARNSCEVTPPTTT